MAQVYVLSVTFRSNENPFSTLYDAGPYAATNDEDAIDWARGMRVGLGEMYDVTLLKDGQPLNIEEEA